jgi:drug/metabolite transporter (DMT)-like permease
VANTLVIMATVPMFAAILGLVLLREGIRRDLQFCIAASFIGVAVTFGGSVGVGSPVGDLFAVATALFYALYLVLLRLEDRNVVLETLLLAGVTAAVLTLPFADPLSVPPADVTILAIQCGLLLPIAFALFFSGVNYLPPAEVALIGLLETVLGPVWVWVFLGEAPGAAALSGGALVVLAVVWSAITGSRPTAPSTAGITGSR